MELHNYETRYKHTQCWNCALSIYRGHHHLSCFSNMYMRQRMGRPFGRLRLRLRQCLFSINTVITHVSLNVHYTYTYTRTHVYMHLRARTQRGVRAFCTLIVTNASVVTTCITSWNRTVCIVWSYSDWFTKWHKLLQIQRVNFQPDIRG